MLSVKKSVKTLASLSILLLYGCATSSPVVSVNKTFGPSGQPAYRINCSGPRLTWEHCYVRLANLCGEKGYTVLSGAPGYKGVKLTMTYKPRPQPPYISRSMVAVCKGNVGFTL